jgi:type 1 fimbria pilin
MTDPRYDDRSATTVERRGTSGAMIAGIVLLAIALLVALLFATGFWSADVKEGELPKVNISANGGKLPDVDLKSKEVVVGTKSTTVDVPKVKTEKEKINVPVVAVKDDEK